MDEEAGEAGALKVTVPVCLLVLKTIPTVFLFVPSFGISSELLVLCCDCFSFICVDANLAGLDMRQSHNENQYLNIWVHLTGLD